jgi:hypothetical protein
MGSRRLGFESARTTTHCEPRVNCARPEHPFLHVRGKRSGMARLKSSMSLSGLLSESWSPVSGAIGRWENR